jgi:hypothetical protein
MITAFTTEVSGEPGRDILAHPIGRNAGRLVGCAEVSKKPTDLMTPLPAWMR